MELSDCECDQVLRQLYLDYFKKISNKDEELETLKKQNKILTRKLTYIDDKFIKKNYDKTNPMCEYCNWSKDGVYILLMTCPECDAEFRKVIICSFCLGNISRSEYNFLDIYCCGKSLFNSNGITAIDTHDILYDVDFDELIKD